MGTGALTFLRWPPALPTRRSLLGNETGNFFTSNIILNHLHSEVHIHKFTATLNRKLNINKYYLFSSNCYKTLIVCFQLKENQQPINWLPSVFSKKPIEIQKLTNETFLKRKMSICVTKNLCKSMNN